MRRAASLATALAALACLCAGSAPLRAEAPAAEAAAGAPGPRADAAQAAPEAAAEAAPAAAQPAPPPGAEALAHELSLRLLTLQQREEAIELRERGVSEVESESQRILDEVGALQAAIEARVGELQKGDVERIARLAKVYAAMPPASAATLLEALPLDVSARVLAKMKQKSAAQILAVIQGPAAVRISKNVLDPLQLGSDPTPRKEAP